MASGTGKLIICPTPLGNLGDMPPRAIEALRAANVVCCEDTRVTGKLLVALGVKGVRLERLDEATIGMPANRISSRGGPLPQDSCVTAGEAAVARVLEGETVVYCSDAGMPGVSDPGQRLVEIARQIGAPVEVLPGPSAVVTAYVASGFTCPRFFFAGFFPRKAGDRAKILETCANLDSVCIFFESPRRLVACLASIADALPYRRVAVCRELTKLHEEVVVDSAGCAAALFADREKAEGIKGECVVVIDAPGQDEAEVAADRASQGAAEAAARMLAEGVLSRRDMAAALQDEFGISRNDARRLLYGS